MGKRKERTDEEQVLFDLVNQISKQLEEYRPAVLEQTQKILNRPDLDVYSLHGKIGGKNDRFAGVADNRFQNYSDFQLAWLNGLLAEYNSNPYNRSLRDLIKLYKDDLCNEYITLFQQRNFYKHYQERVRKKPDSQLWAVWFGGALSYGLFIAPAITTSGKWRIDHSEIRRASYKYWTIGHILKVGGFINPEIEKMYPMKSIDDIENFYTHVLQLSSNSKYEKEICKLYVEYLKSSKDINSEPFLIPEMYYEGAGKKCKYRLDFTVLNPHTFEFTGFEISPSSTHMHHGKLKDMNQDDINSLFYDSWVKECDKRRDYFKKFGINTVTFFDDDLMDINSCFNTIAGYLSKRDVKTSPLEIVLKQLDAIKV